MLVKRIVSKVSQCFFPIRNHVHKLHTSAVFLKVEDRKGMMASLPDKDDGTSGEISIDVDGLIQRCIPDRLQPKLGGFKNFNQMSLHQSARRENFFPDAQTSQQLFNDISFAVLPICNIRISPNNTIISVTDSMGTPRLIRSCGVEGFKNTRKGTNIAAQATAITISEKVIELGWKAVRVNVRGLGPGRMSAIKGLQMGGLTIVSITDTTPVSWNPPRGRKQRSL